MLNKLYELLFGPKYMSPQEEVEFNWISIRFNELLRYRRLGTISNERYLMEKQLLLDELDNIEIKYS